MPAFSAITKTLGGPGRLAVLALALGAGLALCGCDNHGYGPGEDYGRTSGVGACPRPTPATGHQPQFNQQQHEIRALRELAFRGDFFAQLELGDRYGARRDADKNLDDPIESAVWYALALTNPQGYETLAPAPTFFGRDHDRAPISYGPSAGSLYDDCRNFERVQASQTLGGLWTRMSSEEQEVVRKRFTYVLSTQGAPGYRILSRVAQTDTGAFGAPRSYGFGPPPRREWWTGMYLPGFGQPPLPATTPAGVYAVELFTRNDVDAYLYDYLAAQGGDVSAFVLLKDFEQGASGRQGYADFVEAKANRWVPPYEFYPPEAPSSGVPHSDESSLSDEASDLALSRIDELPFVHVVDSLRYLRVLTGPVVRIPDHARPVHALPGLPPTEVQAFQAMLGREQTGHLTPLEKVRAVQYAAVNGSTHAELVLAVMYAEGVGVRSDYARAFHWFQEADRGGSPEAKFAIANYFSLGVGGVADQDKAKAVVYRLDSALAGFRPSANRIQGVLAQVSRRSHYSPEQPHDR